MRRSPSCALHLYAGPDLGGGDSGWVERGQHLTGADYIAVVDI